MNDPISIAIQYVRACGPVTVKKIARELKTQLASVNSDNAETLALAAINHGFGAGWIVKYDEESYCIA